MEKILIIEDHKDIAEMLYGMSVTLVARRVAVTMISSIWACCFCWMSWWRLNWSMECCTEETWFSDFSSLASLDLREVKLGWLCLGVLVANFVGAWMEECSTWAEEL